MVVLYGKSSQYSEVVDELNGSNNFEEEKDTPKEEVSGILNLETELFKENSILGQLKNIDTSHY